MKIDVKESTMVRPIEPTARTCLRLTNLDALYSPSQYVPTCHLYGSNSADNFFDSTLLKAALGRALVLFYPLAGRLKMDDNNHIEIDCNDEGALFVGAVADGAIDDLGDIINTSPDLTGFTPPVGLSHGISACPVFLVQVTRFRCGGVCLGIASQHQLADGISALHFIKSWSDIARGCNVDDIILPFLDRRAALSARDPPQPKFAHIEYQTPPKMGISPHNGAAASSGTLIWKRVRLTRDQMNALKDKCKEEEGDVVRYSTFEVLAGHVWRCATMAWQLPKDQETKLHMAVDGRTRLQQPALPQGYFGNVVFHATPVALAGELYSNPIRFAANQVHEAIARMDNEYLRSAIDYLEQQPDLTTVSSNLFDYKCPNLAIISWARLPFYDVDFGWGRPIYVGRAQISASGMNHILPTNDGSILFGISFLKEQMEHFEKLFYDI